MESENLIDQCTDLDPIKTSNIERKLLVCEYPYQWQIRELIAPGFPPCDKSIAKLSHKLNENLLELQLPFHHYITYIALAYEYGLVKETEKAIEVLQTGEDKFNNALAENNNVLSLSPAFLHILRATKVFLLKQNGDLDVAFQVASEITAIDQMNNENVTAVKHGFRALFIGKYGLEGIKRAVECLNYAIKMNENESMWHYLTGFYTSRSAETAHPIENVCAAIPYMERALKMKNNSVYSAYLADLYGRRAKYYRLNRERNNLVYEENEKSWKLYKESIELNNECPETLFRCAQGFLLFPTPFRDVELAGKLVHKALEKFSTNGYGNHVMAQYYEKIKELENAVKHLKICAEYKKFGATFDFIRLQFKLNENTDFVQKLEDMRNDTTNDAEKIMVLYELVVYCLFVSKELRKACDYTYQLLDFEIRGVSELQKYSKRSLFKKSSFTREKSLCELLMDEVNRQIREKTCSPEDEDYYNSFLKHLSEKMKTVELERKIPTFRRPFSSKTDCGTLSSVPARSNSLRQTKETINSGHGEPLSWRKGSRGRPETAKRSTRDDGGPNAAIQCKSRCESFKAHQAAIDSATNSDGNLRAQKSTCQNTSEENTDFNLQFRPNYSRGMVNTKDGGRSKTEMMSLKEKTFKDTENYHLKAHPEGDDVNDKMWSVRL